MSAEPIISNIDGWSGGELKQRVIRQALALRAQESELFARGDYLPLAVTGEHSANVIAFLRRHQDRAAIVIATRLSAPLLENACPVVPQRVWRDTVIVLPDDLATTWNDAFTRRQIKTESGRLRLNEVLSELSVALLAID
jgi:(1->4)-alpha-D-glucan 1-alpha-D-glucosylmutase